MRIRAIDIVVAGLIGAGAVGLSVAVLTTPSFAAEPRAERTCVHYGVLPNSAAYEQCVSRVTRALEWGEPEMATTLARISRDAKNLCVNSGVQPASAGFSSCLEREIEARSMLVFTDDQIHTRDWPAPTLASQ